MSLFQFIGRKIAEIIQRFFQGWIVVIDFVIEVLVPFKDQLSFFQAIIMPQLLEKDGYLVLSRARMLSFK